MKNKSLRRKIDFPLISIMIVLTCLGLLMVLSSSSVKAVILNQVGPYYYFIKQLIIYVVSYLAGFFILFFIPTKSYKKYIYIGLFAIILFLLYLLLYGRLTNSAKSWYFLFGVGIQPSEFAKLLIIIYLGIFYDNENNKKKGKFYFLIPLVFCITTFVLVCLQPDFGTASIIATITFAIFLSVPLEQNKLLKKCKIIFCAILVIVIGLVIVFHDKLTFLNNERFNFTDPCERYTESSGYQVCNGFIALNNGGLFGLGLGNSTQKYLYLPEAHTDFIFPILVEELGLITGIVVLILYVLLIFRIFTIAKNSYTLRNSIICFGIGVYLMSHIFLNLGGILALIPLTGVTLPFLSYGGSSTLTLVLAMFVVQRINYENKLIKIKREIKTL